MTQLKINRVEPGAILPEYGSDGAAGLDLFMPRYAPAVTVQPWSRALIKTGIEMAIPKGLYGRIAPRSGYAFKSSITTDGGVIDNDYRGEVGVILVNNSDDPFKVAGGMKIAQMVLERYERVEVVEADDLGETGRGTGGFGSTGGTQITDDLSTRMLKTLSVVGIQPNHPPTAIMITQATSSCPYCDRAEALLRSFLGDSVVITPLAIGRDIDPDEFKRHYKTVPQIWLKLSADHPPVYVGGYQELTGALKVI